MRENSVSKKLDSGADNVVYEGVFKGREDPEALGLLLMSQD